MASVWGACVAQLVKHLTLDLSSGLDLWVMSSSPVLGLTFKKKKQTASVSLKGDTQGHKGPGQTSTQLQLAWFPPVMGSSPPLPRCCEYSFSPSLSSPAGGW